MKTADHWVLDNGTFLARTPSPLSKANRADAEWFLAGMLVIFPLLGIDASKQLAAKPPGHLQSKSSRR
ncbi:hypothetical protein [Vreelandella hamiltonii]|uniref:Uncharacterized protein n=2 Tax=Halomonadaceae TaxID=28256 RepID=A0A8H9ILM7_9GAMM|nr:hypothetical protein [Halomonas johnsoniae]GGW46909.1 hypothetical protein GCM10007158_04820 [Halomonas johnsoniae]GHD55898.1 hypothetical protein GCM10007157_06240 [Halomonas hamiltonii]